MSSDNGGNGNGGNGGSRPLRVVPKPKPRGPSGLILVDGRPVLQVYDAEGKPKAIDNNIVNVLTIALARTLVDDLNFQAVLKALGYRIGRPENLEGSK
jgi:hypothetical protein